jgi:lysophospholipase L1-like esterase
MTLLLAGASIVTSLAVAEAALRAIGFRFQLTPESVEFGWPDKQAFQELFVADPELLWVPGDYPKWIDNLAALERPIVFLGDSCTHFGGYAERFDAKLHAAEPSAPRVAKLGVGGWSSYQGLRQLERDVAPRKPAVVSFYFGWNDHWIGFGAEDRTIAALAPPSILGRSRVVQLVTKARLAGALRAGRRSARISPGEFRSNLVEMVRVARAADAVPLLLTAPSSHARGAEPAYLAERWIDDLSRLVPTHERYVQIVRDVAASEQASLCDLHARFSAIPLDVRRDRLFTLDGIHLQPEGDEHIADFLLHCFTQDARLAATLRPATGVSAAAAVR